MSTTAAPSTPRSNRHAKVVLAQTAKAWYLDRMVLLCEDMKARNPGYFAWER
jgi:hypothetical protein